MQLARHNEDVRFLICACRWQFWWQYNYLKSWPTCWGYLMMKIRPTFLCLITTHHIAFICNTMQQPFITLKVNVNNKLRFFTLFGDFMLRLISSKIFLSVSCTYSTSLVPIVCLKNVGNSRPSRTSLSTYICVYKIHVVILTSNTNTHDVN